MELVVRNVNHAFSEIFWKLKALNLEPQQTRNGPAIVHPEMVTTVYKYPTERVLFHAGRDANPVFHLMESVWMLAGRNDVGFLELFNKRMGDFSDDGGSFNAAYGHRWRSHFGHDQLIDVIELLRADPTTRQAVIQMWDSRDLLKKTKDKACNTQVVFDVRNGRLNMTVFNRSNDIWWGAYGANAVHFSVLQEFVATASGNRIGVYRQVSNNFHLYTELYNAKPYLNSPPVVEDYDYYSQGVVRPFPLMVDGEYKLFLAECEMFCTDPFNERVQYVSPFLEHVAKPMALLNRVRRAHAGDGRYYAQKIRATDWRRAALEWVDRREKSKKINEESAELDKLQKEHGAK